MPWKGNRGYHGRLDHAYRRGPWGRRSEALLTQYFQGIWIRAAFIPLPVIGAYILLRRMNAG